MGKQVSLADIKAEADRQYGDFEVDGAVFRSIMRLTGEKKAKASGLLKELQGLQEAEKGQATFEETNIAARGVMTDLMMVVAATQAPAKALCAKLDDAELLTLVQMYIKETQPGEASSSES